MPNLNATVDGHNKTILENTLPPKKKKNHAIIWKKNIAQWEEPASMKIFLLYAKVSCGDKKYKPKLYKEICATTFKKRYSNQNIILMRKKAITIQIHLQNTWN